MTSVLEAAAVTLDGRLAPTDLQVKTGELVAVIGPNGSGKTSLLRALADVERTSGRVRIGGEDLEALGPGRRSRVVTFLPASRDLVWPISARDVIALGLPKPDPARIDELIALLELDSLAHRPVDRLSTGERARVLLARALAPKPKLLLLDEPMSNLDPYWVLRLLQILRHTVSEGASALVTLHDIDRIDAFDRALLMAGGQIRADHAPDEMFGRPALSAAFLFERAEDRWTLKRQADRQSSP